MARLMLALLALLVLALLVVVWVVLIEIAQRRPSRPADHASNRQWQEYYERLASDARRTGDEASALTYESLARTYGGMGG